MNAGDEGQELPACRRRGERPPPPRRRRRRRGGSAGGRRRPDRLQQLELRYRGPEVLLQTTVRVAQNDVNLANWRNCHF
jgi:hypothetical protein